MEEGDAVEIVTVWRQSNVIDRYMYTAPELCLGYWGNQWNLLFTVFVIFHLIGCMCVLACYRLRMFIDQLHRKTEVGSQCTWMPLTTHNGVSYVFFTYSTTASTPGARDRRCFSTDTLREAGTLTVVQYFGNVDVFSACKNSYID